MVTLDIGYRPLGRVWSCRHLHPKRHAADDRWYAACLVGDGDGRRRWAEALGKDRLKNIERIRQVLTEVSAPFLEQIWRHKRRQLELIEAGDDPSGETSWLRTATDRLASGIEALLRREAATLDAIHFPQDACNQLIRVALDRLVVQASVDFQLDVPDEVLDRFPPDLRLFFRPSAAG